MNDATALLPETVRPEVLEILRQLDLLDAAGHVKLLDSLATVDLVAELEQRFGLSMPTRVMNPTYLATVEKIVNTVCAESKARGA